MWAFRLVEVVGREDGGVELGGFPDCLFAEELGDFGAVLVRVGEFVAEYQEERQQRVVVEILVGEHQIASLQGFGEEFGRV